ncbi:MAG: sulfotransferase [Myxococcota bacterium]
MSEPIRIPDLDAPQLPFPVRAINRLGRPLAPRLISLDPENLLDTARRKNQLDDFGEDDFRAPFEVLCDALDREAGLHVLGRFSNRSLILQLLTSRLRLAELFRRHPEIAEERIERPIIIAGLPRTGTTHLHNLISQDPSLRSLPYWESLEPFPDPKETATGDAQDPRWVRCGKALDFLHQVMPLFPAMHEMEPDAVHEEIQLLAIAFSTMLFESSCEIPSYVRWYKQSDQRPAYRYLRRCLQALQWLRGPKRWILKSPQHLEQLEPLIEVFPDACVVQTHRDPLRITASLCTMLAYGHRMSAASVDPHRIGRIWSARVEDLLRGSIEGRAAIPDDQVFDVHFREFMKDDVAMVERVLAFAGHPLTEDALSAMQRFMDAHPRGRHGTIRYVLEDLGLDAEERRGALRFYSDHFDVAAE